MWGEEQLDHWMQQHEWCVFQKNNKIFHGEIDRVYVQRRAQQHKFCVVEVKTKRCRSEKDFFFYFSHLGGSHLIRKNQVQSLYRHAEKLLLIYNKHRNRCRIFIRYFVILKLNFVPSIKRFLTQQTIYKVCSIGTDTVILSFVPEP